MNAFLKLKQIRDVLYGRERNRWKTPEQITSVVYFHVTFFRVHERETATEIEFDIALRMILEHVLTQRFKQSTTWTAKVN